MIVTFYSYKGGVGRSMALANVARWLQMQGLRVVMVDWDLEAPGLESFFASTHEERDAMRGRLGLIDLLVAYKEIFPSLPREAPDAAAAGAAESVSSAEVATRRRARALKIAGALSEVLPPLAHVLIPIQPAPVAVTTQPQSSPKALRLLSAGSRGGAKFNTYAETVQDFDWEQFYAAYEGEAYFEWLRLQLLQPDVADIVLIDSRTGVAEMSGACTRQLADVITVLCAPNDQNLDGVERMADSFVRPAIVEARGNRAIELVMVQARVDISEGKPVDQFDANFRSRLDRFAPAVLKNLGVGFSKLRIPYVRQYAYGDRLAIGEPDGVKSLQDAFAGLATHIAALAPVGGPIRAATRAAMQRTFGLPTVAVLPVDGSAGDDVAAFATDLRMRLEAAGTLTLPLQAFDALLDPDLQRRGPAGGPVPVVIALAHLSALDRRVRDVCRRASQQGIGAVIATRGPAGVALESSPRWLRRAGIFDGDAEFEALLKTILSRPRVVRTPFTAPPAPEEFVNRADEIRRIRQDLLQAGRSRAAGLAIVGAAGIGKSALAAAVCHDDSIVDYFDDGIVWASVGAGANLLDVYSRLMASFAGDAPSFQTVEEARRALVDLLNSRQCLVVLDDVWDVSQLVPVGAQSNSRVLVTTRAHDVGAEAGSLVALGPLPPGDAVALLTAKLQPFDAEAAAALADRLGAVPLAIRLANRIIRTRGEMGESSTTAVRNFTAEFDEDGLTALEVSDAQEPGSSVVAGLRASAERLTPEDRTRLPLLARIQPGVALPADQAARSLGLGQTDAEALFRRLAAVSLIDFDAARATVLVPQLSFRFFESLDAREKQSEAAFEGTTRSERRPIFISYQPDSTEVARRVADRLVRSFGYGSVFVDFASISPGFDQVGEIERAIGTASLVVALIGKSWRASEESFTIRELSTAFERGIRVLPLLVDGAVMPPRDSMPPALAPLARLQALALDTSQFQHDMDVVVKSIDRLVRTETAPDMASPPTPPAGYRQPAGRRLWSWAVAGAAAALLVMVGFWTVRPARVAPAATAPSESVSDERITTAAQLRQAEDVNGAIALLSRILDGSTSPAVRAQALRDRAYCYKLQAQWTPSITDLSTALALSASATDVTRMMLKDRAYAYLEFPDVDAALADYETVVQLNPADRDGVEGRDALRAFLKPTQGFLFVFPPNGAISNASELPVAVQRLDQISFLNLRFWWHRVADTEVRYTSTNDEPIAAKIALTLRASGIEVKGPTLLSSTVRRSRRVEVWLTRAALEAPAKRLRPRSLQ